MTSIPGSAGPTDSGADLESLLFACLERPEAERESAFDAACVEHPALAEALQRCRRQILGRYSGKSSRRATVF